jgi:hypothetical protein
MRKITEDEKHKDAGERRQKRKLRRGEVDAEGSGEQEDEEDEMEAVKRCKERRKRRIR